LDWTEGLGGPHNHQLAFAALLDRWNVSADAAAPCGPRIQTGLRCVQGRDEFADLRRLNQPAVLELRDGRGQTLHAALVQVNGDRAVLQVGDRLRQVPIPALESRWTRQYVVLWRPPPGLDLNLGVRRGSPEVEWLRERIGTLKGVEARTLPLRLEGPLKMHLQAFQTEEGLPSTGLGDLRTLVHLASRTEPGAPLLESPNCRR
jgi:general secretion pathway protein A